MTERFLKDQKVWFGPSDPRDKGDYYKIEKVGRKYYTITNGYSSLKIDKETNYRSEYPSGKIYKDKQEEIDYNLAHKLWAKLYYVNLNLDLTLDKVKQIYNILGLEIND